ncbi:MAG: phage tail protein [Acidimicrobiales bacterium]
MPLLDKFDGAIGASFGLKIDKHVVKGIKEVSGLNQEFDMVEVKTQTADGKFVHRKIPGRPKPITLTITRPLTEDDTFEKWMKEVNDGLVPRDKVEIVIYDSGMAPIKRYIVENAQPSKLEITQLAAGANSGVDEKLTVQGESLTIEK